LAILEFIWKIEIAKKPNPLLFKWTLEALKALEYADIPDLILYQFIWRWIENSGFHPRLNRCLKCGKIHPTNRVLFSISKGGYFCSDCSVTGENSMEISVKCIKLLLYFREKSALKMGQVDVSEHLISQIKAVSWRFLSYHSNENWSLRSLDFLERLNHSTLAKELKGIK
jgi:DNA repair protein RecO